MHRARGPGEQILLCPGWVQEALLGLFGELLLSTFLYGSACGEMQLQVRVGVCVRERSSGVEEEEAFGGSCSDVEEDSGSSQTEKEI